MEKEIYQTGKKRKDIRERWGAGGMQEWKGGCRLRDAGRVGLHREP